MKNFAQIVFFIFSAFFRIRDEKFFHFYKPLLADFGLLPLFIFLLILYFHITEKLIAFLMTEDLVIMSLVRLNDLMKFGPY